MKASLVRLLPLFFLLGSFSASPAADQRPNGDAKSPTLQVQVSVPPMWRPLLEEDIAEAFVARVRDVFRRRGYEGEIKYTSSLDEPSPGCCLMTVNLIEWRVNHIGNVECTFTATLQTDRTTRNLGVFTYSAFHLSRGRFGLADAFDDAAEGAIRDLYFRLAETELVPGLRRRS